MGEVLSLDPSLYRIAPETKESYTAETGITDDKALKEHIMAVTAKTYAALPYPCLRILTFAQQLHIFVCSLRFLFAYRCFANIGAVSWISTPISFGWAVRTQMPWS